MKYLSNALCAMANSSKQNKTMECAVFYFDEPVCPKSMIEK